jgi:hypothetical protein
VVGLAGISEGCWFSFHDSMLIVLSRFSGRWWVWLGGTFAGSWYVVLFGVGSARCWVLRGHLWVGCFFWLLLAWAV